MGLDKRTQLQIIHRAALHGLKIGIPVYPLPVHHPAQVLLQHHVQPDPRGTAVSFPEGMGNVHLHVFGDDFFKGRFRHFFDNSQNFFQVQAVGKAKVALGDIDGTYLPGKVVQTVKKLGMYLLQAFCRAHFHTVNVAALEQTLRIGKAAFINIHDVSPLFRQ